MTQKELADILEKKVLKILAKTNPAKWQREKARMIAWECAGIIVEYG